MEDKKSTRIGLYCDPQLYKDFKIALNESGFDVSGFFEFIAREFLANADRIDKDVAGRILKKLQK